MNFLKARHIRVNSISPGVVVTPAYKNALKLTDQQIADFSTSATATIPAGRPGTADEIARAVLFLASNDSSYATGIDPVVDGGMTQV